MDSSWYSTTIDHGMFCSVCRGRRIQGISWTNRNLGRRYVKCPNIVCDDFVWIDPAMCARSKQIIPGLLRRINKAESEIETAKLNERKLWEGKLEASKSRERKLWVALAVCVVWIGMLLFKS
ncbi:hypothetical protein Vadar_022068 [Vaccinium darrowii]|uniref:Uncharacterized protein n=1 Tax=Vaccinium darrowii TaxID=229202 RepID=A0ACB7XSA6_9ERIC|nr:hypothetical protein Vadar_022068 [Vaccinium darrowii]